MAARQIVVAFRMGAAGFEPRNEASYLTRVRGLRSRGEALGGKLVAWSGALLALAWDTESIEEALLLATSGLDEAVSPEAAWSSGVAEGELEPLAPEGQSSHLSWGYALLAATRLAGVALAGESLVDGDVRALREGQLSLVGPRASIDAGQRVRGWRLDTHRPWKRGHHELAAAEDDASVAEAASGDLDAADFPPEEFSTGDVLEIIEASVPSSPPGSGALRSTNANANENENENERGVLVERLRRLARGPSGPGAVETLSELRSARSGAEGQSAATRCQAAIALSMGLFLAGRPEDALLEALDALARAHEAGAPRARAACIALLSKLYAAVGMAEVAVRLHQTGPKA